MANKYILVIGNIISGFRFEGLFDTVEYAEKYAEHLYPTTIWWVAPLEAVDDSIYDPSPITEPMCIHCNHPKSMHSQTVHGAWVCNQCNCRIGEFLSEKPKGGSKDF